MAGYGIYEGVSGLPYSVGGQQSFVGKAPFGSPSGQSSVGEAQGSEVNIPTQAQTSPGNIGSSGYESMMPQWMRDYFDANIAGDAGGEALHKQRALAYERLPALQRQYGERAALNPYFTQQASAQKGFDPFKNSIYTNNTTRGRFDEYQPWFVYDRTATEKRNPFTGQVMDTQYSYNMAPGPQQPQGNNGSWGQAAQYAGIGGVAMGPVGAAVGGYMGITGKKPW